MYDSGATNVWVTTLSPLPPATIVMLEPAQDGPAKVTIAKEITSNPPTIKTAPMTIAAIFILNLLFRFVIDYSDSDNHSN